MLHSLPSGHGYATCDRCLSNSGILEGDVLEKLELLGWAEATTVGVPGRWWCAACVSRGDEIVVPRRGKRYRR